MFRKIKSKRVIFLSNSNAIFFWINQRDYLFQIKDTNVYIHISFLDNSLLLLQNNICLTFVSLFFWIFCFRLFDFLVFVLVFVFCSVFVCFNSDQQICFKNTSKDLALPVFIYGFYMASPMYFYHQIWTLIRALFWL